jgi:hypothetical protein
MKRRPPPDLQTVTDHGGLDDLDSKYADWFVFMEPINDSYAVDRGQTLAVSKRLDAMFGEHATAIEPVEGWHDGYSAVLLINPADPQTVEEAKRLAAFVKSGGTVDAEDIKRECSHERERYWESMELGRRVRYLSIEGIPLRHARSSEIHPDLHDMLDHLIDEDLACM